MKAGLFISFEGPDGSGKTTQITRLTDYLKQKGMDILVTREPGGTLIGEKIRDIILDKQHTEMSPLTEAMLYAASRAQHVAQVIRPALSSGCTVICDRFIDSSIVYQGYGRKLGDCVQVINNLAVDGIVPDLTILLLVDPDEGKRRLEDTELDRLEMEKIDYHREVYKGYIKHARLNKDRILLIDGSGEIEEISQEIIKKVEHFIEKNQGA